MTRWREMTKDGSCFPKKQQKNIFRKKNRWSKKGFPKTHPPSIDTIDPYDIGNKCVEIALKLWSQKSEVFACFTTDFYLQLHHAWWLAFSLERISILMRFLVVDWCEKHKVVINGCRSLATIDHFHNFFWGKKFSSRGTKIQEDWGSI